MRGSNVSLSHLSHCPTCHPFSHLPLHTLLSHDELDYKHNPSRTVLGGEVRWPDKTVWTRGVRGEGRRVPGPLQTLYYPNSTGVVLRVGIYNCTVPSNANRRTDTFQNIRFHWSLLLILSLHFLLPFAAKSVQIFLSYLGYGYI